MPRAPPRAIAARVAGLEVLRLVNEPTAGRMLRLGQGPPRVCLGRSTTGRRHIRFLLLRLEKGVFQVDGDGGGHQRWAGDDFEPAPSPSACGRGAKGTGSAIRSTGRRQDRAGDWTPDARSSYPARDQTSGRLDGRGRAMFHVLTRASSRR